MEADYGLDGMEVLAVEEPLARRAEPGSRSNSDSAYYETRFLEPDEFWRVEKYFHEQGVHLPNSEWSKIAVVEDVEGEIISFCVLQPIYHLEPFWTRPDHEHEDLWERTLKAQEDHIRYVLSSQPWGSDLDILICSPRPGWERRFKKYGYENKGWSVLIKKYRRG